MIRKLMIAAMVLGFLTSCGSKEKKDDTAGAGDDAAIEQQDMSFDPQGSDSGNIEGLKTVFFAFDQATLSPENRSTIQSNVDWLKDKGNVTLQIEGHADSRGSTEYNLALGERRAQAVKSYMESLGISGDRLNVTSYGEEKPLAEGDTEDAYTRNRRVNFVPIVQ